MTVILCHGVPGSGKSTFIREELIPAEAKGRPIVVHDPARAGTWSGIEHVESVAAVVDKAWGEQRHVAFDMQEPEAVTAVCSAALKVGQKFGTSFGIVLVLDELAFVTSEGRAPWPLVVFARTWRHIGCSLLMATQRINDCNSKIISATSRIYTFRVESPRTLDYLRTEYGLDPAAVCSLGVGQKIEKRIGLHG